MLTSQMHQLDSLSHKKYTEVENRIIISTLLIVKQTQTQIIFFFKTQNCKINMLIDSLGI